MKKIVYTQELILKIISARRNGGSLGLGYVLVDNKTRLHEPAIDSGGYESAAFKEAFWETKSNCQELCNYKFLRIVDHHLEIYFTINGRDLEALVWSFIDNSFLNTDCYKKVVKKFYGHLKDCYGFCSKLQCDFEKYWISREDALRVAKYKRKKKNLIKEGENT
jgi:hypothetical protein